MFIQYNPNPANARVGDCVIRAISKALNQTWESTYVEMIIQGYMMYDMPSANHVFGALLRRHGFERKVIPNTCPDCYTVEDFCADHPKGTYVLCLDGHVVCAKDGSFYDTWNSGGETVNYYFERVN